MEIKSYDQASELWLQYREGIRLYLLKKLKNSEAANDLTQQVLLKIYNSCCSGNDIQNFRSWAFQISHNASIDFLKSESMLTGEPKDQMEEMQDSPWMELEGLVEPLLGLLPKKYAEPLRMADLEGMKQADVAKKLNLSHTAIKSRVQRARELLRKEIQTCCMMEYDGSGKLEAVVVKQSCTLLQKELKK